jgi:hypothetical protein
MGPKHDTVRVNLVSPGKINVYQYIIEYYDPYRKIYNIFAEKEGEIVMISGNGDNLRENQEIFRGMLEDDKFARHQAQLMLDRKLIMEIVHGYNYRSFKPSSSNESDATVRIALYRSKRGQAKGPAMVMVNEKKYELNTYEILKIDVPEGKISKIFVGEDATETSKFIFGSTDFQYLRIDLNKKGKVKIENGTARNLQFNISKE